MVVASTEISESNTVSETVTDGIGDLDCGNIDSANLDPTANPVPVGENAYEKWFRLHVVAINDSNKIDNIRIWKSAGAYVTDEGIQCNLRTSSYVQATYATPSKTTYTNQTMPIAEPGTANLGIAGSLTGSLTAAGYSDYARMQRQSGASTPPGDANSLTISIKYDEQ